MVQQSADGGLSESCNGSMGDVESDEANRCDLIDSKVSKLIQVYAYSQAHEANADAKYRKRA